MKMFCHAISLIGHEPIDGEFSGLKHLADADFQAARAKHLSRRPTSATTDNAGVVFLFSLVGAPICLVIGLIKHDGSLLFSSAFWIVVEIILFFYLVFSATYWREHRAIISEEFRRYGSTSFGWYFGFPSFVDNKCEGPHLWPNVFFFQSLCIPQT